MKKILAGLAICFVATFVWLWLFLPEVANVRPAARRVDCADRLKQLVLAMHTYHDVHGTLPPAVVYDENGKPMHSWRALILPYMDKTHVFDDYDFEQPWDSPNNLAVAKRLEYRSFFCPELQEYSWWGGLKRPKSRYTSYVAVTGPGTAFDGDSAIRLDGFPDGTSRTILLVEYASSDIQLLEPRDLTAVGFVDAFVRSSRASTGNDSSPSSTSTDSHHELSHHNAGFNVGLADGSVRCVSIKTQIPTIRALTTIAGGDTAIDF